MPNKARIFYVEDDGASLKMGTSYLKTCGHKVIETASSRAEALEKIPNLGKKRINVAIVDGNLSPMGEGIGDGEKIASAIKAQCPNIVVIGHALIAVLTVADLNCPKTRGVEELERTIRTA